MSLPTDLRYTASHEWVRQEEDGSLVIGLTAHAQDALGEIVFLELPAKGKTLAAGDACGVIESVKAASDIYAPVSGEITDVNSGVEQEPGSINETPYEAWLFRIQPSNADEVAALMSAEAYQQMAD